MTPPLDRDAILRRRTLFVASALSGVLASTRPARAEPTEPCPPTEPPNEQSLALARELYAIGSEANAAGDYELARRQFERAYEVSGLPLMLFNLAQVAGRLGDYLAVARYLEAFRRCAPEQAEKHHDKIEALEREAQGKLAALIIQLPEVDEDVSVLLDDVPVPPAELGTPRPVNPGDHELIAERGAQRTYLRITVREGQTLTVTLDSPPDCGTEPCVCLQPCLQPCLEPPFPPEADSGFGVSAGYDFWLRLSDETGSPVGHAGRARAYYQVPLGDAVVVDLGLEGGAAVTEHSTLVPVGGALGIQVQLDPLFIALRLSAGYVHAKTDKNAAFAVQSGAWLAPRVGIGAFLSRHWTLAFESGPLMLDVERAGDTRFAVGFVTYGLMLGYDFEPRCGEDDYDCLDDAQMARF